MQCGGGTEEQELVHIFGFERNPILLEPKTLISMHMQPLVDRL